MPSPPPKTLSPAELAKLEHAFATDPSSEAYKPLAEAYLGMGRFMEAMVVCKKGVKAHPTSAQPRVLLGRVYAEQGKDKKALEELQGALQVEPKDKEALRLIGGLQMKAGETEAGKANLLKALEADPKDEATRAVFATWKLELPGSAKAPEPAAPPPNVSQAPAGPPVLAPASQPGTFAPAPAAPGPSAAQNRPAVPRRPSAARGNGAAGAEAAGPPRPPVGPRYREDFPEEPSQVSQVSYRSSRRRSEAAKRTLWLAGLVCVGLVSYYGVSRYRARQKRECNANRAKATAELKHDSYYSYQKACESAEKALEYCSDASAPHAYLAYAYAIRWGDHGGGDDARKKGEENLAQAKKGGEPREDSYIYASEALLRSYSGRKDEVTKGLAELEKHVKDAEAEGKQSSLLNLTLGIMQMNAGDLERARESLLKAQGIAPDDPRTYAALGSLYRRRGQDQDAWRQFDFALRYERTHPESILGKSLLILEQENPEYGVAAKYLASLIEAEPPPSPRQLATAYLLKAFLVSRLSKELPDYKPADQQKLLEQTKIPAERSKQQAEMQKAEDTGFTLDSVNPELKLIKGRRLYYEGQIDQSVAEINKAIQADPTRAQFYVELARALSKKPGGEEEEVKALRRAIDAMGRSPALMLRLGLALKRQNKVDEAVSVFQETVKADKNPEARMNLAFIYKEKNDLSGAQGEFLKAAQEFIGQSMRAAAAYAEAGVVFEQQGQREKADDAYQKALNAEKDYAPAYCYFMKFLEKDRKQAGKVKEIAKVYLQLEPKGECAALAQAWAAR